MKLNKLIFIFILLIFATSCVSAAQNTTQDNLKIDSQQTVIENSTPSISQDEQIASEINVTFDEKMYERNLSDITVSLPEGANGNLNVRINGFTLYDANVTNSTVVIPIEIPPMKYPIYVVNIWPPFDMTRYEITAFYNGIEVNVTHDLYLMKYPKDHSPVFTVPSEVLQFGQRYSFMPALMFPRSANGTVEIYLDGRLLNTSNVTGPFVYFDGDEIISLGLGNHTLMANYSGDDYYSPEIVTWNFSVVSAVISIPPTIYLDHDDCISVSVLNTTKGSVSVFIDSRFVTRQSFDKYGEFLYSLFKDITCGVHEIRVLVECDGFTRERTVTANTTYSIDMYSLFNFRYGEKNIIYVDILEDMRENLFNITVNGMRVPFKKDGNELQVDVSGLDISEYTVIVSYLGDDKYYPTTISGNFSVEYAIYFYESTIYYGYDSDVRLNLPHDADGNLSAYIDGVLYKTARLEYGKALLKIGNLNPGSYEITLTYTGTDYEVENISTTLSVHPALKYESLIEVGSRNVLEFRCPESCAGRIWADVAGRNYTASIRNGFACIDFSDLPLGEWEFDLCYSGDDGRNDSYFTSILVCPSPARITNAINAVVVYGIGTYKVRVFGDDGKIAKNALVTFKINGKFVRNVRTNAYGWAILKIPVAYKPGQYTITAQYKNVKVSKKLTVRHLITLANAKVKKSAKKLVLTAKLNKAFKGKTVTFKFNNRVIKVKINSYGIARATVTKVMLAKLKAGKYVFYRATFLKDTVMKSAKVFR